MTQTLSNGLAALCLVVAITAADITAGATPQAMPQYTALPIATATATAVREPQFKIAVPLWLIGMPANADIASTQCQVILGTSAAGAAATGQVDTPIPVVAGAAPSALRELKTTVTVPVTFPDTTSAAKLAGPATFKCFLSIKHGTDPQTQVTLAPIQTSPNGALTASFPLLPGNVFVVTAQGGFP